MTMNLSLPAKAALLQVLTEGPGYGLELIDRVRKRTDGRISLHQGSIYPALRALERDGLLESHESGPLPERGGRPRRYYKLTAEGLRTAREHRRQISDLFGVLVPEGAL